MISTMISDALLPRGSRQLYLAYQRGVQSERGHKTNAVTELMLMLATPLEMDSQ
jgi:hypothetical protein